ncbi:MAG: DUF4143 domain-containing protein [Bacteroidota bacterium]
MDNGLIRARSRELSPNRGRLLENMVFIELVRRGYHTGIDLFYYKTRNDREIDFICRQEGHTESAIQVSYDITDRKTLDREIASLLEAAAELQPTRLVLLTWQSTEVKRDDGIEIIPVGKWLTDHQETKRN